MKVMLYVLAVCSIALGSQAKLPTIRKALFSHELTNSIGWQTSKGGRSWTLSDYRGFNRFISNTSKDVQGLSALRKWGIPHDCFDAVISMHFIYALKHGLAVNYGHGLVSTKYYANPRSMLQKILVNFGTLDAQRILYPIDLSAKENLQSGMIYVYGGSPGHALYLASDAQTGFFYRLEGPFPASHAKLAKSVFFQAKWITKSALRRFPLYRRSHSKVTSFIPTEFKRGSVAQQINYFAQQPSVWMGLARLVGTHGLNIKDFFQKFKSGFCHKIAERIDRVNQGVIHCNQELTPDIKACSAGKEATYSTPSFDKSFKEFYKVWNSVVLHARTVPPLLTCDVLDFHKGIMDLERKSGVQFYINNPNNHRQLNPVINNFSHNPMDDIYTRWGSLSYSFNEVGRVLTHVRFPPVIDAQKILDLSLSGESQVTFFLNRSRLNSHIKNLLIEDEVGNFRTVIPLSKFYNNSITVRIPVRGMINIYLADRYEDIVGTGFSISL